VAEDEIAKSKSRTVYVDNRNRIISAHENRAGNRAPSGMKDIAMSLNHARTNRTATVRARVTTSCLLLYTRSPSWFKITVWWHKPRSSSWKSRMRISRKEVFENHSRLVERNAVYRRCGFDVEQHLRFVLSKTLPLPGRILEIGTGKGRFLALLLAYVSRVTTIDVDRAEQRLARLNVAYAKPSGRARFMIADAANLPWEDHSFDSVVSVNALHHMQNLPRVLDEIFRVVRLSGKIVLADFNARGFSIMEECHQHEGRIHEHVPYRFQDLVERFSVHGWTAALRPGDCQDVLIAAKAPHVYGGRKK